MSLHPLLAEKLSAALEPVAAPYNQLRLESQELMQLLSVFPDTFSREAVSTVGDRNSDEVTPALGELLNYSLLEWDPVRERYRMNALVKSFASNRLDLAGRMQRQRRLAEYYLAVLQWANVLYVQGGEAILQGLALYDLEVTNIRAGQSWSSEHALEDKAIGQLSSAFPRVGTEILRLRQYPSERIKWLDAALAVARQYRIREDEVLHLINLGSASADLGNNRELSVSTSTA